MTAYSSGFYWVQTGTAATSYVNMLVTAGTYPCRIRQIEYFGGSNSQFQIINYVSPSYTGGTAITPLPMRGGAPASTATAKVNVRSIPTGTASPLNVQVVGAPGAAGTTVPGSTNYSFPFDYILPPGSAVFAQVLPGLVTNFWNYCINIYYEELRLSFSF